jgi:hypothetical protein
MASTYTSNLHLELQATGENSGTWGSLLNANDFTILDNVLGNVQTISLSSTDVTLTTTQTQVNWIKFTGALTADVSVIFPAIGRTYLVTNSTTGSHTVTLKIGTSTGTTIQQGYTQFVGLDGSDVTKTTQPYVPLSGGTMSGLLTLSLGNATTGTEYLECKPTDFGTGKPYFFIKKASTAPDWQIGLWDGSGAGGTINVLATGGLQENNQRVYSPNNPQINITGNSGSTSTIPTGANTLSTYILATGPANTNYGSLVAGSTLTPADAGGAGTGQTQPTGTWRAMGWCGSFAPTLWMRVS